MYLKSTSLGEDIPIVAVLKAMGVDSDQEIIQLVGSSTREEDAEIIDLFAGSLEEPYSLGIFTRNQVRGVGQGLWGVVYICVCAAVGAAVHWEQDNQLAQCEHEQQYLRVREQQLCVHAEGSPAGRGGDGDARTLRPEPRARRELLLQTEGE